MRSGAHYRMSGPSDLVVASIYSIVEFKMIKLVQTMKFLSSYRKN